jgi:uncharacterized membrane protein YphA (DoxX/SURF4 family)
VALGLFTRYAAFIMSGEMAFAYFLSHAPHGFFPMVTAAKGRCSTASSSFTWQLPAVVPGVSTG